MCGTYWRSDGLRTQIGKWGGSIRGAERTASQNQPLGEGASLSHLPRHFGGEETLKLPNRRHEEFTYFQHSWMHTPNTGEILKSGFCLLPLTFPYPKPTSTCVYDDSRDDLMSHLALVAAFINGEIQRP
jgi:hypothetical protein